MADETLAQTVARNLTPENDTSKAALGPGGMFTSGDSPQSEGEQQYKEKFGSPQEVAYGKMKAWLSDHEQHFSDKILKPFREGLDSMADQIDTSPVVKAASPTAQGVAKGTAELLRQVPVGKDVKSTAVANIGTLDFGSLEGHVLEEAAPEVAYRARPIGQKGIAAGERPVATSSLDKAKTYKENLESMTGQPHEVVQIPLKAGEHTVHAGPDNDNWYSFKKDVPEESVKIHGKEEPPEPGSEPESEREIRTRTQGRPMPKEAKKPAESSSQTEQTNRDKLITHINEKNWYHTPPEQGAKAYEHRGKFSAASESKAAFYAPFGGKIEPHKTAVKNPLIGTEKEIAEELGVPPQRSDMAYSEMRDHDRKWALAAKNKGYDAIVTVNPKQWENFKTTGKVPSDIELNDLKQLKSDAETKLDKAKKGLGK